MKSENFDKLLEELIQKNKEKAIVPTLLLHSCCAPCSSYVLEYLSKYFKITVFYYNPNISPEDEYLKRKEEQTRLIQEMKTVYPVQILDCDYDNSLYEEAIQGLENEPERGSRCTICFRMRLEKTAQVASREHFDYFGTTLTVSPYKNAKLLNEMGRQMENTYSVKFLFSDFKKKNGYKRSIELSQEYHLYRQDYCGCKYSKLERERLLLEKKN